MGKSKQVMGKSHNYPSGRTSYSTSCKGVGGRRTKVAIFSACKALKYFDKLKQKQQQ